MNYEQQSLMEIDEDACLALTGSATQCGNGLDTDASDAQAGLCGVHADTDAVRVTDFENPAWITLRDEFVDILRNETNAYALATLSPDVEDVWHTLTGLQDFTIGPVEFTAGKACSIARDLADHPDLDVDDHPLVVGGCIALQGKSAKNHSCPNGGYGASLLCGMHKEAELRGTVLDDGEPGPDLEDVTVDGEEYLLVERRGADLIVVDVDEWELRRLDDAARDKLSPGQKRRLFDTTSDTSVAGDGGHDETEGPEPPSSIPKYIREGVEKQSAEDLRTIAGYATELASHREEQKQQELEEAADQDVDETPDEWEDDEWEEELEGAREKAELPEGKGSLTTKTIDGRDYYYLQWREGDKIRSQYVAPVAPADSG